MFFLRRPLGSCVFCFPDKSYRKLREDVYAEHSGRCALCGRKIESLKNARVLEKYEPRVETVEINGEKREAKKLALMGMELLCNLCYMIKTINADKFKHNEKYRRNMLIVIQEIMPSIREEEIIKHLSLADEHRKRIQTEYRTIHLSWLKDKGYYTKK